MIVVIYWLTLYIQYTRIVSIFQMISLFMINDDELFLLFDNRNPSIVSIGLSVNGSSPFYIPIKEMCFSMANCRLLNYQRVSYWICSYGDCVVEMCRNASPAKHGGKWRNSLYYSAWSFQSHVILKGFIQMIRYIYMHISVYIYISSMFMSNILQEL